MADIEKLAEQLSSLTVIEAADLAKLLEEKWGVSASAAQVAVSATPAAGGGEEAKSEHSESSEKVCFPSRKDQPKLVGVVQFSI